jgi:formylglycine-generating enzyme required for sulfatase activity
MERARQSIDADAPMVQVVSNWLTVLQNKRDSQFEPVLSLPCNLRQYVVESLLGYGGMGEVYKAHHKNLKRPVALKVMRSTRQNDPIAQAHFLREIETAGQLDHPNLVRAYDAWEQDGFVFLAQELLDGDSIRSLAKEGKFTCCSEVLNSLLAVCHGIKQLHHRGFIHRDIHPANIMKLRDGAIKLIDYGLAVPSDSDWIESTQAGTIGYMAPEQSLLGAAIDQRCDIYSLGCVLRFLLSHLPTTCDAKELDLREQLRSLSLLMTQPRPEDRPFAITDVIQQVENMQTSNHVAGEAVRKSILTRTIVSGVALLTLGVITWYLVLVNSMPDPISVQRNVADESSSATPISLDLKMVDIPVGKYTMGGIPEDSQNRLNELPQRSIDIKKPFRISAHEITIAQFQQFVTATGYKSDAEKSGEGGWLPNRRSSYGKRDPQFIWSSPGYTVNDNFPVTMVSYSDAVAFCNWLSQHDGKNYRLPTEIEWEFCCRAGEEGSHSFPLSQKDEYVWWFKSVGDQLSPRPVGTLKPNAWGLYDMQGNVREWCLDWYSETAYQQDANLFPEGPPAGEMRAVRGGCYMDLEAFARSSHRGYLTPTTIVGNQGFRVVEVLP